MFSRYTVVLSLALLAVFNNLVQEVNSAPNSNLVSEEVFCEVDGVKHKPGDTWSGPVGECTTNKCTPSGTIFGKTCGEFQVSPESRCTITDYDLTVQFPDCCPKANCPETLPPPVHKTLEDVEQEA